MTGPDDEFDEFLARKRPLFQRPADVEVEPPNDLDRLVLRQARDAIEPSQPERLYRGPGWGVPLAVAATLLLCLSMVLHVAMPKKATPEGATQQVAQRVDAPAADAATDAGTNSSASPTNNPAPQLARSRGAASPADKSMGSTAATAAAAPDAAAADVAASSDAPWRADARRWLAEIERLRSEGKSAEADAEMALYKRQHRAYASSPDR